MALECNVWYFNPRSLAGATVKLPLLSMRKANFNPRSLTGATYIVNIVVSDIGISIHAPSRERRASASILQWPVPISIHAPSRERHLDNIPVIYGFRFQSTLPCESDGLLLPADIPQDTFQSTLPCGSDGKILCQLIAGLLFQSTLPHGSDVTRTPEMVAAEMFQSTLPHGSDGVNSSVAVDNNISIHAPSRERPLSKRQPKHCPQDFNPRSLTGATTARYILKKTTGISIHAPSRERPCYHPLAAWQNKFQSTLPHGSDLTPLIVTKPNLNFNPRSLTGATNDAAQKD